MKGMGGSHRPWYYGLAVLILGASATIAALTVGGPASGLSTTSHKLRAHSYNFDVPNSSALVGANLFVTNAGNNSVTEIKASSGAFVASISGARFGFDNPTAIAAVGNDLFVTNGASNSVTEFRARGHKHIRTIAGTNYGFGDPIALASSSQGLFVLNGAGSITEISAVTGALLGTASGPAYGFSGVTGLAMADGDVFVANSTANTVTVIKADTLAFVTSLSGSSYSFSTPTGIAFDGTNMWVTNEGASSVTEFSPTSLTALNVLVSSNLPMVGPIASGGGYVFTVSPWGSSPMVSQITPSPATVNWMMCNTNGPYNFNDPEALTVAGANLWVVSRGGDSLTEMNTDSGALIRTISN